MLQKWFPEESENKYEVEKLELAELLERALKSCENGRKNKREYEGKRLRK